MRNVFLDANVLLDFFRFGEDDIAEIGKLVSLGKDSELRIFSNDHLRNEVMRNREKELSDSFNELKSKNFGIKAPNYCHQLPELEQLKEDLKAANKSHGKLVTAAQRAIKNRQTAADRLLKDLWEISHNIPIDEKIIASAKKRVELGNPPGKRNSLGDAIHWESLLTQNESPLIFNLDIVSRDGDLISVLDTDSIKDVLSDEWKLSQGNNSKVRIFRSLSEYFKARFPQIKLSDEAIKGELVNQLFESPNFSTSHEIIKRLDQYEYFTKGQTIKLFQALVDNNQVGWIATDDDVKAFFTTKLKDKAFFVPEKLAAVAAQLLEVEKSDLFDPFPF